MWSKSLLLAIQIASHLAYMVLLPLLIFGGAGLIADRALGTLPLYLLIGLALAFTSTMFWIWKRLRVIIESIKE